MDPILSNTILDLRKRSQEICDVVIGPRAQEVDRECRWPADSIRALAEAGLTGLHVPIHLGGLEQGLMALAVITESLGRCCPSSALCFGMHCVGSAVIAAKATEYQQERYLRPIAEGRHITTLALSESGTGVHFYLPQTDLQRNGDHYVVDGFKQFITNGGHADSYVISTKASVTGGENGDFSCLVLDHDAPGLTWLDPWHGFGMRGNSSRGLKLEQARVPAESILGEEGDQVWYVFEVVAPYFLMAMAGTYLGIAQGALDITINHLRSRRYAHSGQTLADEPVVQHKVADLWAEVEKTRGLVYRAAQFGDLGDPRAVVAIMSAKAAAGKTAVDVANEAMTLCGGMAYRENGRLSQHLRDARASHVMAPTTDVLKLWAGRSLLGLPLL